MGRRTHALLADGDNAQRCVDLKSLADGAGEVGGAGLDAEFRAVCGLANSPFCNISRPEDDYNPVSMQVNGVTSYIPPMYQVGTPAGAGTGNGFAPYDASLGANARFLSPFMPEMQDQDPVYFDLTSRFYFQGQCAFYLCRPEDLQRVLIDYEFFSNEYLECPVHRRHIDLLKPYLPWHNA